MLFTTVFDTFRHLGASELFFLVYFFDAIFVCRFIGRKGAKMDRKKQHYHSKLWFLVRMRYISDNLHWLDQNDTCPDVLFVHAGKPPFSYLTKHKLLKGGCAWLHSSRKAINPHIYLYILPFFIYIYIYISTNWHWLDYNDTGPGVLFVHSGKPAFSFLTGQKPLKERRA